jgi:hypothetical protein
MRSNTSARSATIARPTTRCDPWPIRFSIPTFLADWLGPSASRGRAFAAKAHRISRIVWAEILAGEPLEQRDTVQQIIAPFEVVEIDARATAADIRIAAA